MVAACPLYLKHHSEGEFVFDWSWADAAHRAGIDYYPKLLVGVPFTPVTGARFLTAKGIDRRRWVAALAQAVREICSANDLSGAHVNFCREDERAPLESAGFMPRLGFQYHWRNQGFQSFDDYLASLRSKRRNQVRRERRELESQQIAIDRRVGAAIDDELFPRIYEIYRTTIEKNPWGRLYLNRRFFDLLGERFRERLCLITARQNGEIIAGALNVQKRDTLYGRYWGAFKELRHLHFNICYYAGVEHCIDAGLDRFEPGAGGRYKQMRGFDATPTWSFHYLTDPRLSSAVERFLDAERAEARHAIDWHTGHTARRRGNG
jgi:predicted N-acyltransferase